VFERTPTAAAINAAPAHEIRCCECGGDDGHTEFLYTGDEMSVDGFEIWFCCHTCRDASRPCETFIRLVPPEPESLT
jgi:hypothetical protein